MARTPLDCAWLLQTMVDDPDRFDATSLFLSSSNDRHDDVTGSKTTSVTVRIGWLGDWQSRLPIEDGILSTCQKALEHWRVNNNNDSNNRTNDCRSHFNIIVVDMTDNLFDLDKLWESYNTIRFASTYEKYSEHFDVQYLLSPQGRHLIKEELAWELEQGQAIATADDRGKAQLERARDVYDQYEEWLNGIFDQHSNGDDENENQYSQLDVLALPSAQVWPFPIEDRYPKQICGTTMDTYHRWMEVCVPVSFGGLPCVTVPTAGVLAGLVDDNNTRSNNKGNDWKEEKILPMGIQMFAKRGNDLQLLRLANDYYHCFHQP